MSLPLWKTSFFLALLATTWLFLSTTPPGPAVDVPFYDKFAHAGLFLVLGVLGARAYASHPRWGVFAALVFYGICIELAQSRVGRAMEWGDILADAAGSLGVFLIRRRA